MFNESLLRKRAQTALRTSEVFLVREIPTDRPDCCISSWSGAWMPRRHITFLEVRDKIFQTCRSFKSFERMLKVLRPNLLEVGALATLIRLAAPGNLSIVCQRTDWGYLPRYENVWHEPIFVGERLEFFCCDLGLGRFFRVTLSDSYDLEIEDIGPGKRFRLR